MTSHTEWTAGTLDMLDFIKDATRCPVTCVAAAPSCSDPSRLDLNPRLLSRPYLAPSAPPSLHRRIKRALA